MIQQKTMIEINHNDRVYQLYCMPESPLLDIYEALGKMRDLAVEILNKSLKEQEEGKVDSESCSY